MACKSSDTFPSLTAEKGEEFLGGKGSIILASPLAFSFQMSHLKEQDQLDFFIGNSLFNKNWVTAPSATTSRDGLGPLFNARACSSCHFKDGRGRPPTVTSELNHGLLLRLSIPGVNAHNGPKPDPNYGGQLQDRAILAIPAEGSFKILYSEQPGTFDDGKAYSLRKPMYEIMNLKYGNLAPGIMVSPRVAPQMIGLGLLEAISEATLQGFVDPNDSNQDGISGRINRVWDVKKQAFAVGRFGWKANQPTIEQQTAGAFLGDIGITSSLFPNQNCLHANCSNLPTGGTPEIDHESLRKVVLYSQTLAVPVRRHWKDPKVLKGKRLFGKIGCTSCHIPKITTGTHPTIAELSQLIIRPYTDLLLHDMGEGLADHRPDFDATGKEWRTPPLWGIGLIKTVNSHTFFLHDGRARNLEEAVLWHGGEAEASKNRYKALSAEQRQQVIQFLESL